VDIGSSFLPGELIAAFLWAQLQHAEEITDCRLQLWQQYHQAFDVLETTNVIRRPIIPDHCRHNAHMYYLLLNSLEARSDFIAWMKEHNILTVFHYVPLHLAPAGIRYCRASGQLPVTESLSNRIVRLPLWPGLGDQQQRVIDRALQHLR